MNPEEMLTPCLIAAILGALTMAAVSKCDGPMNGEAQAEAVRQGHAEYYLDQDNERQWRWLPVAPAANVQGRIVEPEKRP